jgi:hypothetical protein
MNFPSDAQKRQLNVTVKESYSVLYGAAVLLEEATRIQQQVRNKLQCVILKSML